MQIPCPQCRKQLNVPESAAGKKAKCPACAMVFDVRPATGVAATPVATPRPPTRPARADNEEPAFEPRKGRASRPASEEDDERPRRARNRDDDHDDRPRRARPEDDDEEDDRPRRRSGPEDDDYDDIGQGSNRFTRACASVALFLMIGAIASVVYVLMSALKSFLYWKSVPQIVFGPFAVSGPTPGGAMAMTLIFGLLLTVPCGVFMFIGAAKLKTLSSWGLGLAGAIVAVSLGGVLVLYAIFELVDLASRMATFFQPISLVACLAAAGLCLFPGIRGMMLLLSKDGKRAFPTRAPRGRRRDRYDDY